MTDRHVQEAKLKVQRLEQRLEHARPGSPRRERIERKLADARIRLQCAEFVERAYEACVAELPTEEPECPPK